MGRLNGSKGGDVLLYRYGRRTVVDHQVKRQETGTAQLHEALPLCAALCKKSLRVIGKPDPLIVGSRMHVVDKSQHILCKSLHPDSRRG